MTMSEYIRIIGLRLKFVWSTVPAHPLNGEILILMKGRGLDRIEHLKLLLTHQPSISARWIKWVIALWWAIFSGTDDVELFDARFDTLIIILFTGCWWRCHGGYKKNDIYGRTNRTEVARRRLPQHTYCLLCFGTTRLAMALSCVNRDYKTE